MNDKSTTDKYIDYINKRILPFIDYSKLQASYDTDMVYAKGILNRLHEAMVKVYGSEQFDSEDGDDGFVVIPGVLRGRENGKVCLALLDIDLSSAGEHWGTAFIVGRGVISQNEAYSRDGGEAAAEMKKAIAPYGAYSYCYTADIPADIHVSTDSTPEALRSILKDFRNHRALLTNENPQRATSGEGKGKQSIEDRLRSAKEKMAQNNANNAGQKKQVAGSKAWCTRDVDL
jgi:hypothetical protein